MFAFIDIRVQSFALIIIFCLSCKQCLGSSGTHIIKLGLFLDYDDDIMNGVNNETVEALLNDIRQNFSHSFSVQTEVITDIDEFEAEVMDDHLRCDQFITIISVMSCERSKSLYQLVRDHCPSTLLLAVHGRQCVRPFHDQGIGFPLMTSVNDVVSMLIDMKYDFLKNWDHISLIHDRSLDANSLQDLVNGLISIYGPGIQQSTVTTYRVDDTKSSSKKALKGTFYKANDQLMLVRKGSSFKFADIAAHLSDEQSKYFILVSKGHIIEEVIEKAYNNSLMDYPKKWLVIFTNVIRRKRFWNKMRPLFAITDTSVVQREISEYGQCRELKEGCQLRLAFEVLKEAMVKVSLNPDYDLTDLDTKKQTKNRLLAEIRLLLGTEETVAQHCGNCDRFVLQVYEKHKRSKKVKQESLPVRTWTESPNSDEKYEVKITHSGEWTPFKGLLKQNELFSKKFEGGNLGGRTLTVGIINQPPMIRVQIEEGGKCNVSGVTPEIVEILASRMNFSIKWWCSKEVYQLGILKDGKWTGLLGKLVSKDIDIAANAYWQTWQMISSNQFTFTTPYDIENVGIIVKKSIEDHSFLFVCPFTIEVWFFAMTSFACVGPLLWFVQKYSLFYDYYNMRDGKNFFRLDQCIWYCFGAMLQQGGTFLPQGIPARVIIAYWWFYVIATVTLYSGNMVALLTFPKIVQPVENAQDLLDSWFMSWGTIKDDPIQVMANELLYGPLKDLAPKMKYYDMPQQLEYVLHAASWEFFGFIAREQEARMWISQKYYEEDYCSLYFGRDPVLYMPMSIVLRKDIPKGMIDQINEEMYIMKRSGLPQYWKIRYQEPGNDCMYPFIIHAGDVKKVQIKHLFGSFLILSVGLICSVVALVIEAFHFTKHRKRLPQPVGMSLWQKLRSWYLKITKGALWADWVESERSPLTVKGKAGDMTFMTPRPLGSNPKSGWVNGQTPKIFSTTYGMQYSTVYGNPTSTIYNTKANFNYFSYNPSKNTKSTFATKP